MKRLVLVLFCNILCARPSEDVIRLNDDTLMAKARLQELTSMLNDLPLNAYCELDDAVKEDRPVAGEFQVSFFANRWTYANGHVDAELKSVLHHISAGLRLHNRNEWPTPAEGQVLAPYTEE